MAFSTNLLSVSDVIEFGVCFISLSSAIIPVLSNLLSVYVRQILNNYFINPSIESLYLQARRIGIMWVGLMFVLLK